MKRDVLFTNLNGGIEEPLTIGESNMLGTAWSIHSDGALWSFITSLIYGVG